MRSWGKARHHPGVDTFPNKISQSDLRQSRQSTGRYNTSPSLTSPSPCLGGEKGGLSGYVPRLRPLWAALAQQRKAKEPAWPQAGSRDRHDALDRVARSWQTVERVWEWGRSHSHRCMGGDNRATRGSEGKAGAGGSGQSTTRHHTPKCSGRIPAVAIVQMNDPPHFGVWWPACVRLLPAPASLSLSHFPCSSSYYLHMCECARLSGPSIHRPPPCRSLP